MRTTQTVPRTTPMTTTTGTTPTTFKLNAPTAHEVLLAGSFTNWQKSPYTMKRNPDGTWQTTVNLRPGHHLYKFIVDGKWQNDPTCTKQESNEFGTTNNCIDIR